MAADQLEKEISNSASASKLPYLENLFPSLVIVNLADVNYLIITYYHPCQSSSRPHPGLFHIIPGN